MSEWVTNPDALHSTHDDWDGWLTGDAMMVALMLRGGIRPGDLVKPDFDPVAPSPGDALLRGKTCRVTETAPTGERWPFTYLAMPVERIPMLGGIFVNANTILAWKGGESG